MSKKTKTDERERVICLKCGNPCVLMTGMAYGKADDEPYESGIEEEPKEGNEVEVGVCFHYCETCGETKNMWIED